MTPLQVISSSRNSWTSEPLATLARLVRTFPGLGSREQDGGQIDSAAHRPDERDRRGIARLTGSYHESCAERDQIAGQIIRAARHYF